MHIQWMSMLGMLDDKSTQKRIFLLLPLQARHSSITSTKNTVE